MKKILIACSFLFINNFIHAEQIHIRCEDPQILSSAFEKNWQINPSGPYKNISIVNQWMGDRQLTGALHAKFNDKSFDKNPSLNFSKIHIEEVSHYGLWQIDCQYRIANQDLEDLSDGYLHMTVGIPNYNFHCFKDSDKAAF